MNHELFTAFSVRHGRLVRDADVVVTDGASVSNRGLTSARRAGTLAHPAFAGLGSPAYELRLTAPQEKKRPPSGERPSTINCKP
jgi:hypothetical protein